MYKKHIYKLWVLLFIFFLFFNYIYASKKTIKIPPFNDFKFCTGSNSKTHLLTVNIKNIYLFEYDYNINKLILIKKTPFKNYIKSVIWDPTNDKTLVITEKTTFFLENNKIFEKKFLFQKNDGYFYSPKIIVFNGLSNELINNNNKEFNYNNIFKNKIKDYKNENLNYFVSQNHSKSAFKLNCNYSKSSFIFNAPILSNLNKNYITENINTFLTYKPDNYNSIKYFYLKLGKSHEIKFKIIPPFTDRLTFFSRLQIITIKPVKKILKTIYHKNLFPIIDLNNDNIYDILLIHSHFGLTSKNDLENLSITKKIRMYFTSFIAEEADFVKYNTVKYSIKLNTFLSRSIFAKYLPGNYKSIIFITKKKIFVYSLEKKKSKIIKLKKNSINIVYLVDLNNNGYKEIAVGNKNENQINIYNN